MSKNICVIGTGYVGLLTAIGLADFGNTVVGVDIDEQKVNSLNAGKPPIFESGIEDYLGRNLESGRLRFTVDAASTIRESEVVFIAVGTPSDQEGEADLSAIRSAVNTICENLNGYKVIVVKSTVPIGTNRAIRDEIASRAKDEFDVVSNPEFLREGKAVYDFFHPDRIVIGYQSDRSRRIMEEVYRSLNRINVPFVWCNWETAETIKYSSNGFLALKIGFINQIATLSEEVGADVQMIAKAMGMDNRIGGKFLHAGPGYGGSCFPKDTKALASAARKYNAPITIIEAVIKANDAQKAHVYDRLRRRLGDVADKTIGMLGLAFKAETDDIRESPALAVADMLIKGGAIVQAHDPKAMENFSREFPTVKYMNSAYDATKGCDGLVIMTEWNEYRSLDLARVKALMKHPYIFDMRNVVDQDEMDKLDFQYDFIGRTGR